MKNPLTIACDFHPSDKMKVGFVAGYAYFAKNMNGIALHEPTVIALIHHLMDNMPEVAAHFAAPVAAPVAAPAPRRKTTRSFSRKSQCGLLLAHLSRGAVITRIQADHLYRIAALPRRIKDLEEAGHKITRKEKADATGRPYVEYAMRNAGFIR